jgi:hypothetical protein
LIGDAGAHRNAEDGVDRFEGQDFGGQMALGFRQIAKPDLGERRCRLGERWIKRSSSFVVPLIQLGTRTAFERSAFRGAIRVDYQADNGSAMAKRGPRRRRATWAGGVERRAQAWVAERPSTVIWPGWRWIR